MTSPGSVSFEEDCAPEELKRPIERLVRTPVKPVAASSALTARSFYLKTVKGLESKFKAKAQAQKDVSYCRDDDHT